jgi:hypothetical protein
MKSISSIIPIKDREKTLLEELRNEGKPIRTGVLTESVLKKLGLTPAERRRKTPSGYLWWPGCLRFDLNRLREQGKVYRPIKGYWEIVGNNGNQPDKFRPDKFSQRALNILTELVKNAKSGDIPVSVTMKPGEIHIRFGENIKQTSIEIIK